MFRTLFLGSFLAASLYVNLQGARSAPPQEVVERFVYLRVFPLVHRAEERAKRFFEEERFRALFKRS